MEAINEIIRNNMVVYIIITLILLFALIGHNKEKKDSMQSINMNATNQTKEQTVVQPNITPTSVDSLGSIDSL